MKAAFHTLGCKVNQYETEVIKQQFKENGFEIVSEDEFSDVYIINTCTVTHLADRKSRQYIRRMKRVNPEAIIAVTGCYAQVSSDEVSDIEDVDIIAGTNEKYNILNYVNEFINEKNKSVHVKKYEELDKYIENKSILSMEGRTRAFVKIQEGCNRFCSYCIIPYARGIVRSRKPSSILDEVNMLLNHGYKEIVLTGINTALYGTEKDFNFDINDEKAQNLYGIESIICLLDNINKDFRIRLSSLEPTVVNSDYVSRLLKYEKLCHHLHLSIQSGSDEVIKAMNRHYTRKEYLDIVSCLRNKDKNFGITTDIIVGFPGETESDFKDSLDIVDKAGFLKVHAFSYSKRKDTKAFEMKNQIDEKIKKERSLKLIEYSNEISEKFIKDNIDTTRKVLFEEIDIQKNLILGYTDNYIRVYCKRDDSLINTFADVKLSYLYEDGAFAEVLK